MSDASLLKLEAEFNANSERKVQAGDKVAELEAAFDRLRKRMRKAERKEGRRTQEGARLFNKVMETRADSLEGMFAKVRVRERWNTDEEASEIATLKSLIADLRALADIQS
ncbi:hypothetical protein [Aerobium aerolatum]|uniref:Uncharacterized protein n=1 Tax=Aquamicrobium aerolatum DSM 21857 TaxID=1121003 RepID=A0A1I3SHV6_9HYPH|nr:hypothetical protein [Aquamicrobium aerolatum]SFJ57329.1 hypothetical protein SAMN03080618_03353 [Aquamicrobium aerolatum DSM 21857]